MFKILVLFCSVAGGLSLNDCTKENALDVFYVPGQHVTCGGIQAQQLVASTEFRDLREGEQTKTVCERLDRPKNAITH